MTNQCVHNKNKHMQVSIYLNPQLASRIDRHARRRQQTRSRFIQDLLGTFLNSRDQDRSPWRRAFAMFREDLPPAEEMVRLIHQGRKNRRWS